MNSNEYTDAEERRLAEALEPFTERGEEHELFESTEPTVIQEIEDIIGVDDLTAAGRIHARADIKALLEQRMAPSEFITAAVERRREHLEETRNITARVTHRLALEP